MSPTVTKLSVSVPAELAAEVRRRTGRRGVSGFVARAIAHELEREQLGAFLDELDDTLGPLAPEPLAAARRAWPKR